jgi:ankyrin repeat protein
MESGADVNEGGDELLSVLLMQQENELFVTLLKKGTYVDQLIEQMYYIIDQGPIDLVGTVELLLEHGTTKDGLRQTLLNRLLYLAAYRGDRFLLDTLKKEGAEIYPRFSVEDGTVRKQTPEEILTNVDEWGTKSALNQAANGGHLELVKEFHEMGSPLDGALCFALQKGHGEIIEYVLEQGLDLNKEFEEYRFTAGYFSWIDEPVQIHILNIMIDHGLLEEDTIDIAYNLLLNVAGNGRTETVKTFLAHGLDVTHNHADPKQNILQRALWSDHTDCLKLIIETGGEELILSPGSTGILVNTLTRIHLDRKQTFDYLLDKGADIKQVNDRGESVLHIAVQQEMREIAELSLKKGIDINIQTNDGTTPLITAVISGSLAMTEFVLEHGADTQIQDHEGKTALDYAREYEDEEMIELLLAEN